MAETNYIQAPSNYDVKGQETTAFSTTGKRMSEAEFDKAADSFAKTGKPPEGFTFLPAESFKAGIRGTFEAINQPVQQAAAASTPQTEALQGTDIFRKMGIPIPSGSTNPIPAVASTVNTPEKAASTAGLLAATAATGGTSGLGAVGARALSAAGGYAAGQQLTGSAQGDTRAQVMEPVFIGAITAASEGVGGLIQKWMGEHISQRAASQVSRDISDKIKTKYPHLRYSGADGIEAFASTKEGLQELSQAGIKAIRGEVDTIVTGFTDDIAAAMPPNRVLSKHVREELKPLLKEYTTLSNKRLDMMFTEPKSTARAKAIESSISSIREQSTKVGQEIQSVVIRELRKGGLPDAAAIYKVNSVMQGYMTKAQQLEAASEVIQALRVSGANKGFNVKDFQEYMATRYASGSSLLKDVGQAAGRGQPGGVDEVIRRGIPTFKNPIPIGPRNISFNVPTGMKYSGQVEGQALRSGTSVAVDLTSINEYLKRK